MGNADFESYEARDTEPLLPEAEEELANDGFEDLLGDIRSNAGDSTQEKLAALSTEEVDRQARMRLVNRVYEEAQDAGQTEIEDPDGSGKMVNVEEWFSTQQDQLAKRRSEIEQEKQDVLHADEYLRNDVD